MDGHNASVKKVSLNDKGILASCSYDDTVKIWNVELGECIKTLRGHTDGVYSLSLNNNGILASCSFDKKIKIWNIVSGACLKTFDEEEMVWT